MVDEWGIPACQYGWMGWKVCVYKGTGSHTTLGSNLTCPHHVAPDTFPQGYAAFQWGKRIYIPSLRGILSHHPHLNLFICITSKQSQLYLDCNLVFQTQPCLNIWCGGRLAASGLMLEHWGKPVHWPTLNHKQENHTNWKNIFKKWFCESALNCYVFISL